MSSPPASVENGTSRVIVVPSCSTELARKALLHDASEAYTQDLTGAVKFLIRPHRKDPAQDRQGSSRFDRLGDSIQAAIEERFNCAPASGADALIHRADKQACAYELALGGWAPNVTPDPLAVEVLGAFPALYTAVGRVGMFRPADDHGCFMHWASKLGLV